MFAEKRRQLTEGDQIYDIALNKIYQAYLKLYILATKK
jgi:hypothetical protein